MKILHISDTGLPDPRVERMALTMRDEGHDLFFLGGRDARNQYLSAFTEANMIPLGNGPEIALDWRVKRRWIKAIDEVNPDVVHAHNVLVGHFLLDTEYPTIFDDHENLSRQRFVFMSRTWFKRNAARILLHYIPKWEIEMAKRYPVLTTVEGATLLYRNYTTKIGIVSNMPFLREVEWLENPPDRKGLVFMGNDFSQPKFIPMRDMTGLRGLLDFDIINELPHHEMMMKLATYRIGLIPYLPHPFQLDACPNKAYEYLHAGLQIVFNGNFSHLFSNNPFVHTFNDYSDIVDVIKSIPEIDPWDIMLHARENYIWDKSVNVVKEAYKQAG
jgi:hypothetical protein